MVRSNKENFFHSIDLLNRDCHAHKEMKKIDEAFAGDANKRPNRNIHRQLNARFTYDYCKESTNLRRTIVDAYDKIDARFDELVKDFLKNLGKDVCLSNDQTASNQPHFIDKCNTKCQIESNIKPQDCVLTHTNALSAGPNIQINNNETIILINKTSKSKKKKKKDTSASSTLMEEIATKKTSKSKKTSKLNETINLINAIIDKTTSSSTSTVTSSIFGDNQNKPINQPPASDGSKSNSKQTVKTTEIVVQETSQNLNSKTFKVTTNTNKQPIYDAANRMRQLDIIDESSSDSTLKDDDDDNDDDYENNKKQKKTVKKAPTFEFRMPEPLACSSLSASTLLNGPVDNRPSSILSSAKSSVSSTVAPPKTPKAGAPTTAATSWVPKFATPATSSVDVNALQASGKVKQMVEAVEARMKLKGSAATPASEVKSAARKLQYTGSTLASNKKAVPALQLLQQHGPAASPKTKLRSSIDKRKLRISSSKEVKRQSIKRLNNCVKDLMSQGHQSLSSISNKGLDEVDHHKINESNAAAKKLPIKEIIAKNPAITQQYRLAKNTPFAAEKIPVNRFTPLKTFKSELDEKKKQELAFKEKKEQVRLQERHQQMHEKIEIAKKKREEKMKKIAEQKAKQKEEDEKKKEELDAKLKDSEEAKKRQLELKRKEEFEKLRLEKMKILANNSNASNLAAPPPPPPPHPHPHPHSHSQPQQSQLSHSSTFIKSSTSTTANTSNVSNSHVSTFKSCNQENQPKQPQVAASQLFGKPTAEPVKKPTYENYDLSDLRSDDETDDEEEPSKPIPVWAQSNNITRTSKNQNHNFINFTKLFKAASRHDVNLEEIFKIKRKKFTERSSSANWSSPPVWSTGLNGNESFRKLHHDQ